MELAGGCRDVCVPLSHFLVLARCPPDWQQHNLYLLRDEQVVFYVGQSQCAYDRVWEHLQGGFKGRSLPGRFVLCNWPRALRFTVELLHSSAARFRAVGYDLDAAERVLIEELSPCFNETFNRCPTPLPGCYAAPNALVRRPRTLRHMVRDAEQAVRRERSRRPWG
jgi:hypothetical protein